MTNVGEGTPALTDARLVRALLVGAFTPTNRTRIDSAAGSTGHAPACSVPMMGLSQSAGIVLGVAGTTAQRAPIFTAGLAGLTAGVFSMALGEYVSVSSQRDIELARISERETRTTRRSGSRTR